MRIGIDQGGTFTDLIAVSGSAHWRAAKVPSTPDEPLAAIIAALERAGVGLDEVEALTLGTTLAINALLQRAGAAVAYVTTAGFEDIPFIQRGNRRHPYELDWRKPLPFLTRRRCLGVQERVDYLGAVVTPLGDEELDSLGARLERVIDEHGIEAVAVNLLFSFRNPTHERLVGAMIRTRFPGLAVSLSHEVAPTWREYERGLTTIADAYLKPLARKSIDDLEEALRSRGFAGRFSLMMSNGGIRSSESAAAHPVQLLLSGLVGGVVGGRYFGAQGSEQLVTLDMGGTSCDIAVIADGQQRYADEFTPEFGLPLMFPTIDVATLGAGGGSIAWLDGGGFLRVGPGSAGASPGPACYGLGAEEPTVTDANVVLGRIDAGRRLGGAIELDASAARAAIQRLASRMDLSIVDAALAVIEIADAELAHAIRLRTIEVGIDVRNFSLVAFGGSGPLHAASVARALGIPRVLIPPSPGITSAVGLVVGSPRCDHVTTIARRSDAVTASDLEALIAPIRVSVVDEIGAGERSATVNVTFGMRYLGQNYENQIALDGGKIDDVSLTRLYEAFEADYHARYGYALAGAVIELVSATVTAEIDSADELTMPPVATGGAAELRDREVLFRGGAERARVVGSDELRLDEIIAGPAVIVDDTATTLLSPGDTAKVLVGGALLIEIAGRIEPARAWDPTAGRGAAVAGA